MPAAKYDLALEQGATFVRTFTWTNPDTTPVDLTGATAHLQIRTGVANIVNTTLLDLTQGSGITLGGTAGTITITFTASQTASLTVAKAQYDLYVTIGSTVTRLLEGSVTIDPTVTV